MAAKVDGPGCPDGEHWPSHKEIPIDDAEIAEMPRVPKKQRRGFRHGQNPLFPNHSAQGASHMPYRFLNLSTRPAVSTSFCLPVKKG